MKAICKSAFGILASVIALFVVLAVLVANRTSEMMTEAAERTVKSVVNETAVRVDRQIQAVEAVTRNFAWVVGEHVGEPDYMYRITRELVENNDFIIGSAVAFEPNFYREKGRIFAPYSCVSTNGQTVSFSLSNDFYAQEWYRGAKDCGSARWCEPYFDEGGAGIMMCTYSVPLTNATGEVYAVLTADVSLDDMTKRIAAICPYPQSYAVMISCAGKYLVMPPQGRTFERSEKTITIRGQTDNGWVISIVCPIENVLNGARRLVFLIVLFAALGLLIIVPIAWIHVSRLQRESVVREWAADKLKTVIGE